MRRMKTHVACLVASLLAVPPACKKTDAPASKPASPATPAVAQPPPAPAPPSAPATEPAPASPARATQPLEVGDRLPALTLNDQNGKPVALESFRGKKMIVWFYPAALTPGCTVEAEGFRDQAAALAKYNVAVVGASFDTPAKNTLFGRKHNFSFTLLSDTERALALALGAAESATAPFARRVSALIDEEGRVLKRYLKVDPRTHPDEVLRDLAVLTKKP